MDEFDRRLLNRLQHGLPLEPHPTRCSPPSWIAARKTSCAASTTCSTTAP